MAHERYKTDAENHLHNLRSLKIWLEMIYYSTEYSTVRTKPIISMLITATQYLTDNVSMLMRRTLKDKGE